MTSLKNVTKQLQKEFGKKIGGLGESYPVVERIPTGWFKFDLSSGGGFPRGLVSLIYGPEGSGKTTLSYKLIANHQRLFPKLKNAIIDVEHVYAPDWASEMGVNTSDLYVFNPDFVEQAGDVLETILYSEDCGLVIVDSLAALETSKAINQPMEKVQVAGAAIMIKRMCNKVTAAQNAAYKEGRIPPTVIYVNQIRTKIGVLFGNPETQPGGNTPRFQSSFTVRLWSKGIADEKISKVLPARREIQTAIQKIRVAICSKNAKWEMNLIAQGDYPIGASDDWSDIKAYMEHFGLMVKSKIGYDLILPTGEVKEFITQKDIRETLLANPELMDEVSATIIKKVQDEAKGK